MSSKKDGEELSSDAANLSKLEAVKELIFGQEIQDYSKQFNDIESKFDDFMNRLLEKENNLNKRIDALNVDLTKNIDNLNVKLCNQIEKLNASKTDREKLSKILISAAEKIKT